MSALEKWTLVESILKAVGTGLFLDLGRVKIREPWAFVDDYSFYFRRITIHPDYSCHVAISSVKQKLIVQNAEYPFDASEVPILESQTRLEVVEW